jgi:hypothetical protein
VLTQSRLVFALSSAASIAELLVKYRLLCQAVDAREQVPRYQVAFATHVFEGGTINNANLPSRIFNCSTLFQRSDHFTHGCALRSNHLTKKFLSEPRH